ncbi:MAG: transcriptional regulator [Anaerolineaceae bacterium]|nr:transcriptional regulator [Anaerolineaceae bacterium]
MQKQLVITVTGNDRVGIVDDVTKIILAYQANVEASRMARLGGEFAMLMLVSVAEDQRSGLEESLNNLRSQGFELAIRPTEPTAAQSFVGWCSYQIGVRGADHEGIIHEVAHQLAEQGANVEAIDTSTEDAPFGGTKLFTMSATVLAPPTLSQASLQEELDAVGQELNVDITVVQLGDYAIGSPEGAR